MGDKAQITDFAETLHIIKMLGHKELSILAKY